jgi:rod shape determining protein RodA
MHGIFHESTSQLDRLQLAAVAGLMLVGGLFVYSATMVQAPLGVWGELRESSFTQWLGWLSGQLFFRQLVWYALGIGAAAVLWWADYRTLIRWSLVVYWASIVLLVAVMIPGIGSMRFGARRWIDLGLFQFQPSEFAKLALILALAHYVSRPLDELHRPRVLWTAIGMTVLPFVLILKEPDLGSAIVLLPVCFAMLYVAGAPRRFLVRLLAVAAVLGALFVVDILFAPHNWQLKLQDYQRRRLLVYFGKTDAPPPGATRADIERLRRQQFDDSHNVRQALISVGSGGLTGKGWREGTQNVAGLPCRRAAAHTDFIFSVIAEEKGFVGSATVHRALCGGPLHWTEDRRPGARPPGQSSGGGSGCTPVQPHIHQHRHEHPTHARERECHCRCYLTAGLQCSLPCSPGHAAKCSHLSKGILT